MNTITNHTLPRFVVTLLAAVLIVTSLVPVGTVGASGSQAPAALNAPVTIYTDSLASGWQDWSWSVNRSLTVSQPVQGGARSIGVTISQAWGAFYLHRNTGLSTAGYTHLEFYINGGAGGNQRIKVIANTNSNKAVAVTAPKNTWSKVSIPLANLGAPASITDLYWQDAAGAAQPRFYIDTISLVDQGATGGTATATLRPTTTGQPTATRQPPTATPRPTTTGQPTATRQPPTATSRPTSVPTTTPPGTGTVFRTLPPGSALPSDAQCAAAIKARPENKRVNATYNATRGNQSLGSNFFGGSDPKANSQFAPRVTGNYTGTTDEILQWVACKWGIDEDIVRAQAAKESWWRQTVKGDWTTNSANCAPGHGLGVDGTSGQCPESFGILQNRYPYEQSAWPGIYNSTAFNADTAYSIWRACYEGYEWWLNDQEKGANYAAGDAWGCVGRWFAGRWRTQPALDYISAVQTYYNQRIWETASFQEP
jgi:autotransporter family porin